VRTAVASVPAEARSGCPELLRALEQAYPIRFVGSSESEIADAGAVIVFPGGSRPERLSSPCLVLEGPRADEEHGSSFIVEMSRGAGLDPVLRGQRLIEHDRRPPPPVAVEQGCEVLAAAAGRPVWTRREAQGGDGGLERASAAPSELAEHEFLRDHMTAGRFWSLLPLTHFLKRVSLGLPRGGRPHRACFVIDDPNVRFSSYGYVRFPKLARDARECGYHVAVATIPLDLLLGRRGVRVFRDHPLELSLVVHGNDHVRRELERKEHAEYGEHFARVAAIAREGRAVQRPPCQDYGCLEREPGGAHSCAHARRQPGFTYRRGGARRGTFRRIGRARRAAPQVRDS